MRSRARHRSCQPLVNPWMLLCRGPNPLKPFESLPIKFNKVSAIKGLCAKSLKLLDIAVLANCGS